MKKISESVKIFCALIVSFLSIKITKASPQKDITSRVNKIRSVLKDNTKDGNIISVNGKDVLNKNLSEWVNWGNWGNWNDWNNWRDWSNWGNWGNWGNW